MGWEIRSGKRVYYRKERYTDEGGRSRVRSIYFGSGERAEAAAREDEERRGQPNRTPKKEPRSSPPMEQNGTTEAAGATTSQKEAPTFRNPPDRCDGARRSGTLHGGPVTADEIIERGLARVGHLDDAAKGERERLLRRMVEGSGRDFRLAAAFVGISALELRTRGVELADY